MVTWVVFLSVGLVVGLVAGVFFGQMDIFKKKQREELKTKLDATEKELASYKMEVTEHFLVTSALVNSMTESYQAVHEHLAKGANRLCDSTVNVNRLNVAKNRHLEDVQMKHVPSPVETTTNNSEPPTQETIETTVKPETSPVAETPVEAPLEAAQEKPAPSKPEPVPTPAEAIPEAPKDYSEAPSDDYSEDPIEGSAAESLQPQVLDSEQSTEDQVTGSSGQESDEAAQSRQEPDSKPVLSSAQTSDKEIVEPPSTPESLSFEDEDVPGTGRTVH